MKVWRTALVRLEARWEESVIRNIYAIFAEESNHMGDSF